MNVTSWSACRSDLADVLRWPTERSRVWTCTLLERARLDGSLLAVVAIGSAVRPNVSSADLDLIVIRADTPPLTHNAPLEIDLRDCPVAEIDAQVASGNDLLGWAVKFGKVLFQRDRYWDRLTNSWRDRLPLPSSAIAHQRATNAQRRLAKLLALGDPEASQEQAVSYLTHLARAELIQRGVYPASRPELPSQLRAIGSFQIAEWLERLLQQQVADVAQIECMLRITISCDGTKFARPDDRR